METKWFSICIMIVFTALFMGIAAEKYSSTQCKIAYSQSIKTADEILKLCGK